MTVTVSAVLLNFLCKLCPFLGTGGAPSDLLCQSTIVSIGLQAGGVVVFVLGTLIILTQGSNCASLTEHCQVCFYLLCYIEEISCFVRII